MSSCSVCDRQTAAQNTHTHTHALKCVSVEREGGGYGRVLLDFTGNWITWAHNWSIWRENDGALSFGNGVYETGIRKFKGINMSILLHLQGRWVLKEPCLIFHVCVSHYRSWVAVSLDGGVLLHTRAARSAQFDRLQKPCQKKMFVSAAGGGRESDLYTLEPFSASRKDNKAFLAHQAIHS